MYYFKTISPDSSYSGTCLPLYQNNLAQVKTLI